jgi:hypothetical protein
MQYIIFPVTMHIKRPEDGWRLQPKIVAANKPINTGVLCDWFNTYNYDLIRPTAMSDLQICGKLIR